MDSQAPRLVDRFAPVAAAIHCLLWFCFAAGMLLIVPGSLRSFRQSRLRLPFLTAAILDFSNWLIQHWGILVLAFPLFFAVDCIALIFLRHNPRTKGLGLIWLLVMSALPLLMASIVTTGILKPMAELQFRLSK